MLCPVCPAIGAISGYVGGHIGIDPRRELKYRVLNGAITSILLTITTVVLRSCFGITLCDGNGDFSLRNVLHIGVMSLGLGVIYSIAVNFFINLALSQNDCCQDV